MQFNIMDLTWEDQQIPVKRWVNVAPTLHMVGHSAKPVSMLVHRLRRWSNIEKLLGEWLVSAGALQMAWLAGGNYLHQNGVENTTT